jgi:hypothetical protein
MTGLEQSLRLLQSAVLAATPLQRLLRANAPPADLVGVVEHGVLDGRYLRHRLTRLQTSLRQPIAQAIASMKRSIRAIRAGR